MKRRLLTSKVLFMGSCLGAYSLSGPTLHLLHLAPQTKKNKLCPDEVTLVKYEEEARFDAFLGRGYLGQATNWAKNQDFPAGPLEGAERHATMPSGAALTHSPLIVIIITRPKSAYDRQGLAGEIVGPGYNCSDFWIFFAKLVVLITL